MLKQLVFKNARLHRPDDLAKRIGRARRYVDRCDPAILGAKGAGRRNFELGMLTDDDVWLDAAQERFDRIWSGRECKGCRLRGVCPKPIDTL